MKISICINTKDQAESLDQVLSSIRAQRRNPGLEIEVIVADDGSKDKTPLVCIKHAQDFPFDLYCIRLNHEGLRSPAAARNAAVRKATGDVLILQHGDIYHSTTDTVSKLVGELEPKSFVVAAIVHRRVDGKAPQYGPPGMPTKAKPHPIFYLGSMWRDDYYAVGGCDEEFTMLGSEDIWFTDCLIEGLGLSWKVSDEVVGWHIPHPRGATHNRPEMRELRQHKLADARAGKIPFCAAGGPWLI